LHTVIGTAGSGGVALTTKLPYPTINTE
jgi:hypothetical protein